ncbi:ubiquitin E3 ligase ICP0 [Spheniscid alphaherpesvirus 1]|uniref:RING-type E3 ubiquitin transferase n=1 Tax=Spheniscid alphaherpesvirus 1 TaxID=2560777 RepID=A0A1R3T8D2_9ALPH|nr:ubiquitin E3 ligase ICP0 [Spheniscid alphaherpesvirus 1]SCO83617.1 ubiquitin E3 ligase ICP0 [Spheniscid alphaherpesvirus 1]
MENVSVMEADDSSASGVSGVSETHSVESTCSEMQHVEHTDLVSQDASDSSNSASFNDGAGSSQTCPICIEPWDVNVAYALPCLHQFCQSCILKWVGINNGYNDDDRLWRPICPMCRSSIKSLLYSVVADDAFEEHELKNDEVFIPESYLNGDEDYVESQYLNYSENADGEDDYSPYYGRYTERVEQTFSFLHSASDVLETQSDSSPENTDNEDHEVLQTVPTMSVRNYAENAPIGAEYNSTCPDESTTESRYRIEHDTMPGGIENSTWVRVLGDNYDILKPVVQWAKCKLRNLFHDGPTADITTSFVISALSVAGPDEHMLNRMLHSNIRENTQSFVKELIDVTVAKCISHIRRILDGETYTDNEEGYICPTQRSEEPEDSSGGAPSTGYSVSVSNVCSHIFSSEYVCDHRAPIKRTVDITDDDAVMSKRSCR